MIPPSTQDARATGLVELAEDPALYVEIEQGYFVSAADFYHDPEGCREAVALAASTKDQNDDG
jgi:hypothetical protein